MQDFSKQLMQELATRRAENAERFRTLWQMTAQQRVSAMRRGELSWSQLWEWAKQRPQEVPLVNGEFEFIAMLTPEVADRHPEQDGR